ncbi:MAG: hypothetical protein M2R45_05044 [Verrucomicrobia subdivision 3 bacterium]|nr:hypothetical protein [Limisphaerales bacterium]MCS1412553.1 hypothetical protein [Limisphaerales bacterium]
MGGAVLISGILKGDPEDESAYAIGQTRAHVFGGLLFLVGLYYFVKGGKKNSSDASKFKQ